MIPEDLGPLGDFYRAKFMLQCLEMGAGHELPDTMDWARVDMAADETLRQALVIGATQAEFAFIIAGQEAGNLRRKVVQRHIRRWLEIAEDQVVDGPVVPLWRRFVTSDDVSVSLLYPDPGSQIVDTADAFVAGLNWSKDGGRSALVWGMAHPDRAREAFEIPRRLKTRIERISTRAVDFEVEAAEAQTFVDHIVEQYGGLPWG